MIVCKMLFCCSCLASKHYKNDCMQNVILLFMSSLTVPIVKNSNI